MLVPSSSFETPTTKTTKRWRRRQQFRRRPRPVRRRFDGTRRRNRHEEKKRTVSLDLRGNQKQTTVIEYSGELVAVEIERPLGLVLEESRLKRSVETQIEVVEIVPDSNAAKDGRVKVGDILRLTTAVFNVSAPIDVTTWLNPPAKANVGVRERRDVR